MLFDTLEYLHSQNPLAQDKSVSNSVLIIATGHLKITKDAFSNDKKCKQSQKISTRELLYRKAQRGPYQPKT